MTPGYTSCVTWIGSNTYVTQKPYSVYYNISGTLNGNTIVVNSDNHISNGTVTLNNGNHTFFITYKEDNTYIHKIHSGKKH